MAERNRAYYRKYEEDIRRVKDLIRYISKEHVMLPSGGRLSVLRLRQLGMCFGFHGKYRTFYGWITWSMLTWYIAGFLDSVHGKHYIQNRNLPPIDASKEMICRFTSDLNQFGFFTRPSLAAFENMLPFDTMPLYALIHEPCYARRYAQLHSRATSS